MGQCHRFIGIRHDAFSKPLKIWVKEGAYYGDSNIFNCFHPCSGKSYGGFAGDESYDYDLTLRDLINNQSVEGRVFNKYFI